MDKNMDINQVDIKSLDRRTLPLQIRYDIADWIQEENLPIVNETSRRVPVKKTFYTMFGKRALDIAISLPAVALTLPINAIIGVITFFDVGRPIFFFQDRVGLNGKTFQIIKFRNMRNTTDKNGELLPANQRVTAWGKIVRKTSLDELLNFVSVLKGDMSIIGPRPLVTKYYPRYSNRHLSRYNVKPGLECPPRDLTVPLRTWQDQFENDVWYAQNVSLKTDIMMCANLVRFALDRKNVEMRGSALRGDFMGYDKEGRAIRLDEVPEEYIERALEKMKEENISL